MKKATLLSSLACLLALTSCSKLGKLTADNFKVTPTPLVCDAGEVEAAITVTFPEKYMKKKATVQMTPVLRYAGGEALGTTASYQGEKVQANGTAVNYKLGGSYNIRTRYRWDEGMLQSDLLMRFNAKKGKKTVNLPDVKIGYGTIGTSQLLARCLDTATPAVAPDNFQRVISQRQEASIKFLIAQSNVRTSELQTYSMKDLIRVLREINDDKETRVLNAIEVSAYASPDGRYTFNEQLAQQRQNSSANYLRNELRKIRMQAGIQTRFTAEDWDGFRELIAASNLQDKQVILSVLSMYEDPEEREQQISNMSNIYADIKEGILPELRRARLIVTYEVIGRSDVQIIDQFAVDAAQLSVEELLYAANLLVEGTDLQKRWLNRTIALYPSDYRAYNNLAAIAIAEGNTEQAEHYLLQAQRRNSGAPEVNTNLALLALRSGDTDAAETYLAKGSGANSYEEILGCLNIAKGNYVKAAELLLSTNTNAEALACILTDDLATGLRAVTKNPRPDALTYYLQAIIGARATEASLITEGLTRAVELDATLGTRAKRDLEFSDYQGTVNAIVR